MSYNEKTRFKDQSTGYCNDKVGVTYSVSMDQIHRMWAPFIPVDCHSHFCPLNLVPIGPPALSCQFPACYVRFPFAARLFATQLMTCLPMASKELVSSMNTAQTKRTAQSASGLFMALFRSVKHSICF